MGRPAGWMKALTGRSPMKSPGAPALRRDVERLFWRPRGSEAPSPASGAQADPGYAPGLALMDFHSVVEVEVDGHWQVWDATRLAPRPTLVRVATGRDAADIAFTTVTAG